ncbi:MAG: alpha/beta fold hydrolase [Solirubrobacteraceae bacterium]
MSQRACVSRRSRSRRELTFADGLAAWFYPPRESVPPTPCVVMAHGFGGTRGARLDAFAERFAAAGFGALVFDYRTFGDSAGEPRQLVDIGAQLDDWRAAIAFARSLPEVDADRIALWGTSFSGGHVMVLAAEDDRVAAAVSQGAFADGLATLAGFGPANMARLTWHGLRDQAAALARRPPHRIPIVGPPGTVATMNTPDAQPGYLAIAPPDFRNEAAARVGLRVALYRPGTKAANIACPWLVVVADRDSITPPAPLLKAAARAPRAEVRRHDCQHFDIYVGDVFEANVADQVAFLQRTLDA